MTCRPVEPADQAQWAVLFAGYRAFYRLGDDPAAVATTWQWVGDGRHGLRGYVAVDGQRLLGLANVRLFARPSRASLGLYLDDLFVAPAARGQGVATDLLRTVAEHAGRTGADVVRWITAEDNTTARRVYDRVGTATHWVTYDMPPAAG